jgi:hypothetical protein
VAAYTTQHRTFQCDRCGNDESRRNTEPAPSGWQEVTRKLLHGSVSRRMLLCRLCSAKQEQFLAGRDLEDLADSTQTPA